MIHWLQRWVVWVVRRRWWVLAALTAMTLVNGFVAYSQFKMNSDLGQLIRQDAPWRADFDRFETEFPHMVRTLVLVVSGESLAQVEDAVTRLRDGLAERTERFSDVYSPGVDSFLRDHAFYYMPAAALDDVIDRLAEGQPMLSAAARDPSLRAVLERLRDGVDNEPTAGFERLVQLLSDSAAALLQGEDATIEWADEFFQVEGVQYRLVVAKGRFDYGETLPNGLLVQTARDIIRQANLPAGIDVQVTGEVALAHEEIDAALSGVKIAGWFSVLLLLAVLTIGVRSVKIIAGIFLMLLVGVIWTSAYAMLAVGEYNTLSVVFLVMFFGLGVDFAVHFSLRFQEAVNAGSGDVADAMSTATQSVGGAISLCTLTTAIGFLGFLPTDYKGLADLGVISAGGMFIAAFLTFTLLPAWYAVSGRIRYHVTDLPSSERVVAYLIERRVPVLLLLGAIGLGCGWVATHTHFDYSVLALRDNNAESMRALRTLQREGLATDYSLSVLSEDAELGDKLLTLEEVDSVVAVGDLVPGGQQETQFVLEDAQQILWDLLDDEPGHLPAPTTAQLQQAVDELLESIRAAPPRPELERLAEQLQQVRQAPPQLLEVWQPAVVDSLNQELSWLRRALHAQPFAFADLPPRLQRNLRSAEGSYLTVVNPAQDLSDVARLNRFIEVVQEQVPQATGRPVIEWGVGNIVLDSFFTALAIATVGILLVLFINFRRLADSILILVPLALALVITLAIGVWLDQPLNMANILVVPLIFGLGVDNGIHVVDRYRGARDVYQLMHSSTPRAVVLSTLTTIGTFASLMLSPHQGTASIGFLLTCAVSLVLVLTVLVLPVLLNVLLSDEG